jgi:hypothetical protein
MDTTFSIYHPEKRNKKAGALVFRISNNHIYPVVERARIQSVIQAYSTTENNRTFTSIDDIEKFKYAVETNVVIVENVVDTKKYMMDLIKKSTPTHICLDVKTKAITKFELDGHKYIMNQQVEQRKKICEYLEVEFTGQGFAALLELICGTWEYSKPNPETFNILLEAKKGRAHYGFINDDCEMKMRDEKNCVAYDICKCYSHLMKSPSHDWLIMDFNACFEDFNACNGNIKKGLYLIKTDDTTLFKGDGIYSHNIVLKAKEEDITFRILKVMYASRVLTKNYITEKINKIDDCLKDDVALKKFLINMFHGNMAKTNRKFINCHFAQSSDDVFSWMARYADYIDKAFVSKINDNAFIYGNEVCQEVAENNIPMYIQVMDECNIMMYDLVKKTGGQLVARKTDCFVIYKPVYTLEVGKKWGDVKKEPLPYINTVQKRNWELVDKSLKYITDWTDYDVKDSSNWKELLNIANDKGGLLLVGDAGKGKSYAINEISKVISLKKIAPTNKAALNVNGSTIHSFLRLDKEGKIKLSFLKNLKKNKVTHIAIDEISMINKTMWSKLVLLKRMMPKLIFILVGDDKQCKPIEEDEAKSVKYFDHPVMKYLTNNNRNVLQVLQRFPKELSILLENVNEINTKQFKEKNTPINLCFFNNTRKQVNKMWNKKLKKEDNLFIKEDITIGHSQDVFIYNNLPVIAMTTKREMKDETVNAKAKTIKKKDKEYVEKPPLFVNSETFHVVSFTESKITLQNERTNGIHSFEIEVKDFHKNFCINYCSTVHKSQGDTILEDYTIYDWENMDTELRYTACSRSKRINQFGFNRTVFIQPEGNTNFIKNIKRKLTAYVKSDDEKKLRNDLDIKSIIDKHQKQKGLCALCSCEYSCSNYSKFSNNQFSIDRIDSKLGHTKSNCQMVCFGCNRQKGNAI